LPKVNADRSTLAGSLAGERRSCTRFARPAGRLPPPVSIEPLPADGFDSRVFVGD